MIRDGSGELGIEVERLVLGNKGNWRLVGLNLVKLTPRVIFGFSGTIVSLYEIFSDMLIFCQERKI